MTNVIVTREAPQRQGVSRLQMAQLARIAPEAHAKVTDLLALGFTETARRTLTDALKARLWEPPTGWAALRAAIEAGHAPRPNSTATIAGVRVHRSDRHGRDELRLKKPYAGRSSVIAHWGRDWKQQSSGYAGCWVVEDKAEKIYEEYTNV